MAYESGSLGKIAAGAEDPERYSFRMVMTLRTEDERYAERVNLGLWLGCGVWKGNELILEWVQPIPSKALVFGGCVTDVCSAYSVS